MPRPEAAVNGELIILRAADSSGRLAYKASLTVNNRDVIPLLHRAVLLKVSGNGIAVTGTEVIARGQHSKANVEKHRQTWWCLIHTNRLSEALGFDDLMEGEP